MDEIVISSSAWPYQDGSTSLMGELYRSQASWNGKVVVVVHEADGIGGNVRRHGHMLAELGYAVAAADMHGKGRPLVDDEIGPALVAFMQDRAFLRRRVRAAYNAAKSLFGVGDHDVAAIGYCFGGTAVLELARSGAALAATASFHGLLTTSAPATLSSVRSRILACTGARDPLVPLDDVTTFQREMMAADADWQLCIFGRAKHSFTNSAVDALGDERMAFDPQAEEAAWTTLRLFLEQSFALAAVASDS